MDSIDLYRAMQATARTRLLRGDTAAQVRREADAIAGQHHDLL